MAPIGEVGWKITPGLVKSCSKLVRSHSLLFRPAPGGGTRPTGSPITGSPITGLPITGLPITAHSPRATVPRGVAAMPWLPEDQWEGHRITAEPEILRH